MTERWKQEIETWKHGIGEWTHEKKSYVLYRLMNTAVGVRHLITVMSKIINNDTDVCPCSTCILRGYASLRETRMYVDCIADDFDKQQIN